MKVRMAVIAFVFGIMTAFPAMCSDVLAPPPADQQLKAMENKFFEHDFSKEPEEYRIQRLEKFAFGQNSTGTLDDRLGRLTKVIDTHKTMVAQKPAAEPKAPTQSKYSRELDDNSPQQSAHDKMKWVEDYRPRPSSHYSRPMESVVPEDQRMSEEDRELEQALGAHAAGLVPPQVREAMNPAHGVTPAPPKLSHLPATLSGLRQSYDPAIFSDMPPDSHARMLTRVAWCEQHVFGRTFAELHLPQRLHQLSAELLPNEHVSDLELMDHLDLIVREVVMLQHPPIAYGK